MELYIPTDELEPYAADAAAALTINGTLSGKSAAVGVQRALRILLEARNRYASRPETDNAGRWLLDNCYLAEQAAGEIAPVFARARRLRAAGGRALVAEVCSLLLASGDGEVDAERIERFLAGFQTAAPLTSRELSLVAAGLRASVLDALAALYASPAPEAKRCGVLFTTLRRLGALALGKVLERVNLVDITLRRDPSGVYPLMDEASRRDYRRRVSRLAAVRGLSETAVAERCVELSLTGATERTRHVGFYLYDRPLGEPVRRPTGIGYMLLIGSLTIALTLLAGLACGSVWAGALCFLPFSELVKRAADRRILAVTRPRRLPRLALAGGVPAEGKTVCVTFLLLTGEGAADAAVRRMEEFAMASRDCGGNLLFGLACDLPESREILSSEDSALLAYAEQAVEALNERRGGGFFLFCRERGWDELTRRFLPPERKRGATLELCRLLAGGPSAMEIRAGDPCLLRATGYILSLDSDTRLEPGCARELIGTALHPLNRPITDLRRGLVVRGHGVLAPRLSVSLRDASKTGFARLRAPRGGGDPYGASAGELYMDRFASGGFAGKGLIHVRAYLDCLDGRIPPGWVLSHDALEGAFLRGGFVNDVELTDGFPGSALSWYTREHRWIRGDWQNLPWLFAAGRELPPIERWRLFDSLRRSLLPPALLAGLTVWLFTAGGSLWAAAAISAIVLLPLGQRPRRGAWRRAGWEALSLPYAAFNAISAVCCAVWRMTVSGRQLLQWQTAEQGEAAARAGLGRYYKTMWFPVVYGALLLAVSPHILGLAAGVLWLALPALTAALDAKKTPRAALTDDDRDWLLRRAAEMWRYFKDNCRPETHFLPPDNLQDTPPAAPADRVSPTNLGLALVSALCAEKLGLADRAETLGLCENLLAAAERLDKWHGHLYNWYDTRTLRPLEPAYVSTVDSGNLAACLIAAAEALRQLGSAELSARARMLWRAMDLAALYDEERELFTVGTAPGSGAPATSWYDLLESEERLTGYIAVASGQVPKKHWRRLGRARVAFGGRRGMVSWSGTMFEYLMPELFLPLYKTSHLGQSARFAVYVQQKRTAGPDKLWGVSESAFCSLSADGHYRYKAHGAGALALCRGMEDDLVISPYSSYLALAVTPRAAAANLRKMERPEYVGPYGLWEAVDFTPGRRRDGRGMAVRCVMAHHLGMSLAAVTNALCDGAVRGWFLAEPSMAAYTGLLQERVPQGGALLSARQTRRAAPPTRSGQAELPVRTGEGTDYLRPRAAALSNGTYHLLFDERGVSRAACGGSAPYRSRRGAFDPSHGVGLWLLREGGMLSLLPEPGGDAAFSWEFTADQAALTGSQGGLEWTVCAQVSASLPGERRMITLRRGENAPEEALFLCFEPSLIGGRDYAAHPSFARLGMFTRSGDGVFTVRRLARGNRGELFLALACDRQAEFSSDLLTFPTRSGGGAFTPNEGWQSDPLVAARVILPAGERESRVRFALCISGTEEAAAAGARAVLTEAGAGSALASAAAALGLDGGEVTGAASLLPALIEPTVPTEAASLPGHPRQALWKLGISGDRPILCVECAGEQSVPAALAWLRRCALLRAGGVAFDLVFLTGDEGDYHRRCRAALEEALTKPPLREYPGQVVFASLAEDAAVLRTAAAVWIGADGAVTPERRPGGTYRLSVPRPLPPAKTQWTFEDDGFAFSTGGTLPPRSWGLPMYGGGVGWFAAEAGTGGLWYKNARECPLFPWQGDPLSVSGPEQLCAVVGGRAVSFFVAPDGADTRVRFSFGEAIWEKTVDGVTLRLTAFMAPERSVRVFLLESSAPAEVRWCAPLQLAPEPEDQTCCYVNFSSGVLTAENPRCAFAGVKLTARCSKEWIETGAEALAFAFGESSAAGRSGTPAFCGRFLLEGVAVLLCGVEDAPDLLEIAAARAALDSCRAWWRERVCRLRADGLPEELSGLVNGWSAYAALCCRVLGRSSMYQSGGAIGFRDQLQDYVNLLWLDGGACRAHILSCCAHQFAEGDVQHWWHPGRGETDKGVRTRCSDDLLWLPWAVCEYVDATGQTALCAENAPYITSPPLGEDESSRYELPSLSGETGNVLDHCRRSIMLTLSRGFGTHHLLLMGSGDWNDGFDAMGPGSESVWLTWFGSIVCHRFSLLLTRLGEPDAARYAEASRALAEAADEAWDGDHYLRGYYGDGTPLGSGRGRCCRVDSVAQSFAALCPHADPDKVRVALDTALAALHDSESGLTALYTPPFSPGDRAPGYVATYGPGFRENGGQYTHAAVWLARACFRTGRWEDGAALLRSIAAAARRPEYGAEPFALAADVYTAPGKVGRSGWSWYTGAAGWCYRVVWEDMLGFAVKDGAPRFDPPEPVLRAGWSLRYADGGGRQIKMAD